MNGLRLKKLEEISILLRQNITALFFDIATQALGGFGLENDSFFGMKKGVVRAQKAGENSLSPEVQCPQT